MYYECITLLVWLLKCTLCVYTLSAIPYYSYSYHLINIYIYVIKYWCWSLFREIYVLFRCPLNGQWYLMPCDMCDMWGCNLGSEHVIQTGHLVSLNISTIPIFCSIHHRAPSLSVWIWLPTTCKKTIERWALWHDGDPDYFWWLKTCKNWFN